MSRVKSTISAAGFIIATLGTVTPALAGGGPDAFGYVWLDSNDPMGPAAEWVDITAVGTPVTGLADDNASERIDLPATFRYYWRDETQLTVGSNGWVSFDPVSNIAHCFPSIPTQGGAADGYLAPLMSDLIFSGAGNPASAWTYCDGLTDRFIISYVDVPR